MVVRLCYDCGHDEYCPALHASGQTSVDGSEAQPAIMVCFALFQTDTPLCRGDKQSDSRVRIHDERSICVMVSPADAPTHRWSAAVSGSKKTNATKKSCARREVRSWESNPEP